jgi:hypothetical protein
VADDWLPSDLTAERGSVLMLMPAAVLIVVILGALAVDRAVIFGAQRDLVATAQAAANDGASAGVDVDALRDRGEVTIDRNQIDRAVSLAAARADGLVTSSWEVRGETLVVRLERRVSLVFTKGVPGAADTQVVVASARSVLVRR